MQNTAESVPYEGLSPDTVLAAIESLGARCDGRLLALNSYENRVYQIGCEDAPTLVAKFYRPGRWEDAAILEEHAFALELAGHELPVVAPLVIHGHTLHHHAGYRFAVYPRMGGRMPDLDMHGHRLQMGRFLGRMHAVGRVRTFAHRPVLDVESYGRASLRTILERDELLPAHVAEAYRSVASDALKRVDAAWARAEPLTRIRLHGDCHAGNVLWTESGPHFVDLDDTVMGPAVQDLWMLLAGDRAEMSVQMAQVLEGYTAFCSFDGRELHLIEALRTLRMIHHSAWLARRWHDPAFPMAFPWFAETRYWEDQVLALREQTALLEEGPLQVQW